MILLGAWALYLFAAWQMAEGEFRKGEDRRKKKEDYQTKIREVEEFKRRNHG